MNNAGKIGPPMKPLPMLTAKARIFANRIATRRPRPRVPASCKTLLSWSLPVNRVSGNATPMRPNTAPPNVGFAMLGNRQPSEQAGQPRGRRDHHCRDDGGEQAERNRGQELPIFELVRRHLVGIEEDRADDHEVDPERDARRDDPADQRFGELLTTRAGNLQDQHHHDHGAREQPAVRAGEAVQDVRVTVFLVEALPPGHPRGGTTAHRAKCLLRSEAGAADQRHGRDRHDPGDEPGVDVRALDVGDQPGDPRGELRQGAQHSDHDAGPGRDGDPPPLAPEPARIRNVVPVVPERRSRPGTPDRRPRRRPRAASAYPIRTQNPRV